MKYIKTIKDFTHLHQGTFLLIKAGTLMERSCSEEGTTYSEFYRPLGWKNEISIGTKIVESNPNYFCEITETEWLRESKYTRIFDYILELDPYINWIDFIETIKSRYNLNPISEVDIKDILEKMKDDLNKSQPIPHYPVYPTYPGVFDSGRCPSCGNLTGSPCWNTACPNRLQIWCSTNTH